MSRPLEVTPLLVLLVAYGPLELFADDILQIPHERATDYIHSGHVECFGYPIQFVHHGRWQMDQNCFLLFVQLDCALGCLIAAGKVSESRAAVSRKPQV
jgi:hypothetical protein